ncbi:hypothetical protein D9Q98_009053 [Chlorella vulgaris]|uniref:APAF-1 helical domain-containing protein n=1 Tax=Chlorella vulgaris TaxID=3077 RepID=A0A9D4YTA5_CHLVU|nr:hypothetical protein D9Q98_009053 [Chlorella vulgaris]
MGGHQSIEKQQPSPTPQPQPPSIALTAEALVAHEAGEPEHEYANESFSSWRTGTASASRASVSSRARDSVGSHTTPMSGNHRNSSQWMAQRPSVDTPLPVGGGAMPGGGPGSAYKEPLGASRRSRSSELMRASNDSRGGDAQAAARPSNDGSASVYSAAGSGRSSFALERASLEANRASLEAFQEAFAVGAMKPAASRQLPDSKQPAGSTADGAEPAPAAMSLDQMMRANQLPSSLREKFARLVVLPANTPAPVSMLSKLWQAEPADVKAALTAFAAKGVLNVAQLPDCKVWCLPQAQQLELLQAACKDAAPAYHRLLLDAYSSSVLPRISEEAEQSACSSPTNAQQQQQQQQQQYHGQPQQERGMQPGMLPQRLQDIPDDGYILINLGHHLTAAGRHRQLRELLLDPDWLRRKLVAAGITAVVADFRRYLLIDKCADIKLVLEALQLSAAQAVAHPRAAGLLRCLMVNRLVTAPLSPTLQAWLVEQRRLIYDDSRQAKLSGMPRCLVPLTASLEQAGGLQRLTLRGHAAPATKVLLTPSGTDAVTASSDGTARVWDLDIGDCVLMLEGHAGPITDMAITSDGSLVLTCSTDGTARAFEMERGQCLRVLAGHTAPINALAMDPWARFVVTASSDGTARVWDLSSARPVHTLKAGSGEQGAVLSVALSPCTRFAILGCANGTARMYDVISGQCMGVMAGHTGWVHLVRFLPDGKRAVTASHDGTARVWDLHTGTCRHELAGHTARVNSLVVAADGKWCVTGSEDGTARIWDVTTGHCRRLLTGHKAWISDVALSPANDKLITASGDGTALAYNLENGDMLCSLEGHSGPVHAAVVTRKGRFAVTVSEDSSVRVWDFAARMVQPPSYHEGKVYTVAGSSARHVLVTCGEDCDARLWDVERGTFRGLLHQHKVPIRWAAFSEDGSQLVTVSPDRTVLLWDVASLAIIRSVSVSPGSRIRSFAASSDLSRAVICKWDSTVVVSDLQRGDSLCTLQRWGERDSATGHTSAVNQVLMTPDGLVVVTVSKDCTARVWDSSTGMCLRVLTGHTDSITGGFISPAARLLATFGFDDTLRLWSLDSGQCVSTVALPDAALQVALSPDGWKVAVALSNASVCVFDVEDTTAGRPLEFHSADITGLHFTADGTEVISSSLDASVCVWDVATGAITGMFVADCGFTCSWYDDELEQLAVGTDRGIVHSLDLGLQPRSMPVAAAHTPAAGAGQLPPATDEQGQGQPQAEPNAAGAGGEGASGPAAAVNSAAAQQSQRDAGLPGKGAAAAMPPPPAGAAASQLQGAGSQELQAPPSPAEVEVTASRAVRRSRSPSPARPAVADGN